MLPDDQTGALRDQPHPTHARIAIGIDKIYFPVDENVGVIRAPCPEDERGKKSEPEDVPEPAPGAAEQIGVRNSQIGNFMGPPGFEPGTKGL